MYGPVSMGGQFTELFQAIPGAATAAGMAAALAPVVGSMPSVEALGGGKYKIVFTDPQADRMAEWIRAQLNREPGTVQVDAAGIATKVIFRQYWPWILGVAAAGAALGYAARGR